MHRYNIHLYIIHCFKIHRDKIHRFKIQCFKMPPPTKATYPRLLLGTSAEEQESAQQPCDSLACSGVAFRVPGFGFRVSVVGLRVQGFGLRVSGFDSRFAGQSLGFRLTHFPASVAERKGNNVEGLIDVRTENGSSQGQHLALTSLCVPSSLDSGTSSLSLSFWARRFGTPGCFGAEKLTDV